MKYFRLIGCEEIKNDDVIIREKGDILVIKYDDLIINAKKIGDEMVIVEKIIGEDGYDAYITDLETFVDVYDNCLRKFGEPNAVAIVNLR